MIHQAINISRKILFHYFQWNSKKEPVLRHNRKLYIVSPWGLVWDNENYYMVGYQEDEGKIKHYRVDKMLHTAVIEEPRSRRELINYFNIAEYAKMHFGMFGGEQVLVALKVKNDFAGIMVDRFGKDIEMT